MKDPKRSLRRHHNERLKEVRKAYSRFNWWENQKRRVGMLLHTPTPCSCPMCGNDRKYLGKTLKELSLEEITKKTEIEETDE